jgi:hypothetical protein
MLLVAQERKISGEIFGGDDAEIPFKNPDVSQESGSRGVSRGVLAGVLCDQKRGMNLKFIGFPNRL